MWVFLVTASVLTAGFILRGCLGSAPVPDTAPRFAGRRLASIIIDGQRVRVPIATVSTAAAAGMTAHIVRADGVREPVNLVIVPRPEPGEVAVLSPLLPSGSRFAVSLAGEEAIVGSDSAAISDAIQALASGGSSGGRPSPSDEE